MTTITTRAENIDAFKRAYEDLTVGDAVTVAIPMIGLHTIDKLLKAEGWERVEMTGEEKNGWETDFWYYWTNSGDKICVAGAIWQQGDTYNMYITIDDDEKDPIKEEE
jgi:hypothetical protein